MFCVRSLKHPPGLRERASKISVKNASIPLIVITAIAVGWVALPRIRDALDPNTVRGTVRDTTIHQGYVILFFSKNRPSDGVAIPIQEFSEDLIVAVASKDSADAVSRLLNLGSRYDGQTIVATGKLAKQEDGSRIIGVKSLRDIRFIE